MAERFALAARYPGGEGGQKAFLGVKKAVEETQVDLSVTRYHDNYPDIGRAYTIVVAGETPTRTLESALRIILYIRGTPVDPSEVDLDSIFDHRAAMKKSQN